MGMEEKILEIIRANRSFLITSHVRLDGDAVGSELALFHTLRRLGKKAVIYNEDETPETYHFLPGAEEIVHTLDLPERFEVAFVLDCSELERVGKEAARIGNIGRVINIDHHISNDGFTEWSIVRPEAGSTGEILYGLIRKMLGTVPPEVAVNLYGAIMTDTGSFRYSNTGSDTLRIAGELVAWGADPRWIAEKVYETKPLVQVLLLGKVIGTLKVFFGGRLGVVQVTRKMLEDLDALPEHTEGFVDLIRTIRGIEVAAIIRELPADGCKVSFRSKDMVDVERIAGLFGGGGHVNAAACTIQGPMGEVRKQVIRAVGKALP